MKKIFIAAVGFAVFFIACKQDDVTSPRFTMNGESTITHSLNKPYTDPGVTADDDEDGSVTVTNDMSSTNPNIDLAGHYIITYTATDAAGNKATTTRNVLVVNDAEFMAGAYHTDPDSSGCGLDYTDGIVPSTTVNNRIMFTHIGSCANADKKLLADIDFATATITIVTDVINCGSPNTVARTFSGGGALSSNNTIIDMDITQTVAGNPTTCRYYFVKQ